MTQCAKLVEHTPDRNSINTISNATPSTIEGKDDELTDTHLRLPFSSRGQSRLVGKRRRQHQLVRRRRELLDRRGGDGDGDGDILAVGGGSSGGGGGRDCEQARTHSKSATAKLYAAHCNRTRPIKRCGVRTSLQRQAVNGQQRSVLLHEQGVVDLPSRTHHFQQAVSTG